MSLGLDRVVVVGDTVENAGEFKDVYLQMLRQLERLHRLLLDVIKDEFERGSNWDIKAVQALLLYNIGDKELTTGELRARGYYLGSNVTYNLKKLVAAEYIEQKRSHQDRRSIHIRLTEQGKRVCQTIDRLYDRQLQAVGEVGGLAMDEMSSMNENMQRLERFWQDQIRFKL
ncbi:MAG: winged helix DNA-binding protein [Hyphomicrobiaceae bacterium]|nr:winged helix DNA-binding protein [Hyphomicrobiaceae bacterium]